MDKRVLDRAKRIYAGNGAEFDAFITDMEEIAMDRSVLIWNILAQHEDMKGATIPEILIGMAAAIGAASQTAETPGISYHEIRKMMVAFMDFGRESGTLKRND